MEPITLTLAVGGIVLVLALGGISLKVFQRKNVGKNGPLKTATAAQTAANPTAIKLGAYLTLLDLSDSFLVTAIAVYTNDEDPEDSWHEYELLDEASRKIIYLSAERDDEDRWRWCVHEILSEEQILRVPELADVAYTGKKPPRKQFSLHGSFWRGSYDAHNYGVLVTDTRADRAENPSTYTACISDYVEVNGTRELSVELWNGGRCVSVGRPLTDRVLV